MYVLWYIDRNRNDDDGKSVSRNWRKAKCPFQYGLGQTQDNKHKQTNSPPTASSHLQIRPILLLYSLSFSSIFHKLAHPHNSDGSDLDIFDFLEILIRCGRCCNWRKKEHNEQTCWKDRWLHWLFLLLLLAQCILDGVGCFEVVITYWNVYFISIHNMYVIFRCFVMPHVNQHNYVSYWSSCLCMCVFMVSYGHFWVCVCSVFHVRACNLSSIVTKSTNKRK